MNSLIFEGLDSTGKNFLTLHVVRRLLELGIDVFMTNFPQYFAFGAVIRQMNRGKADKVLNTLTPYEQATHRAAMYALDRSFALLTLEDLMQKNPNAIIVSDRGPDSNAVTLGFICANTGLTPEQVNNFIEEVFRQLEPEFRSLYNGTTILCKTNSADGGTTYREVLDDLERSPAQIKAREIYDQILPDSGLFTKNDGQWCDVDELTKEVLSKANIHSIEGHDTATPGALKLVGLLELASIIFKTVPDEIKNKDSEWRSVSLDSTDTDGQRKGRLDVMEMDISKMVGNYLGDTKNLNSKLPSIGVAAIKRIIGKYPTLLDIIEATENPAYAYLCRFICELPCEG